MRFLAAGLLNSGITYIIYLLALQILPYPAAYTAAFAAGIVIALLLNGKWVFRSRLTVRNTIQFPMLYVVQYLLGLALLVFFVRTLRIPARFAPLLVVACTTPFTFVASRYIFRPTRE